jgi:hypothetical protein
MDTSFVLDKWCSLFNPWLTLTLKAIQLGFDAQNVIALRMMRFAAGGTRGQNEARRMVVEKIAASAEVQATVTAGLITGRKEAVVAGKILKGLQKRVGTNKRRLSRKRYA